MFQYPIVVQTNNRSLLITTIHLQIAKQFRRDQPLLFADRSGGIGVTVERGLRRCKVARRKRPTSRAE